VSGLTGILALFLCMGSVVIGKTPGVKMASRIHGFKRFFLEKFRMRGYGAAVLMLGNTVPVSGMSSPPIPARCYGALRSKEMM
jgi:hypothetical protein